MTDVGLGQLATTTGRYVSKKLKDAMSDSHPFYKAMEKEGGIKRIPGGRTIVDEGLVGQNSTVAWVGEAGRVSSNDYKVVDAPEADWKYILGSVTWTLAERYKNSGGGDTKIIDVVSAKFDALKNSMMNVFHTGMLSAGTGSSGLQLTGAAALISTTPTTGTVEGIDRSATAATWFRNQKFDTGSDWSDGAVDAGNALRFVDKLFNLVLNNGTIEAQLMLAGGTHYDYISQAIGAKQTIVNVSSDAKSGFDRLYHRGIPIYYGNGINYSGETAMTLTRDYVLNVQPGGLNLYFHNQAEFDMLDPVNSNDQAAVSRLMFTMSNLVIGARAKYCVVGFD